MRVANRRSEGSGALSAESVGGERSLISICVIISRITGFARTWSHGLRVGLNPSSPAPTRWRTICRNMLYELVMGGMLITAFLPVYLSVKKQLGDRRGNEYASNLLHHRRGAARYRLGALHGVRRTDHLHPELLLEPGRDGARSVLLPVLRHPDRLLRRLVYRVRSLNANREYFWSSFAPVFNNLIVIASFILYAIIAQTDQNLAFLAIAIGNPLGVFVQMAFQIPALKKVGIRLRPRIDWHDPALADTLRLGAPAVFVTVCSFATVSAQNAASYVFADNGPSVIAYARLWFTFPYSFLAVPVTTTLFTELSDMQADREYFAASSPASSTARGKFSFS